MSEDKKKNKKWSKKKIALTVVAVLVAVTALWIFARKGAADELQASAFKTGRKHKPQKTAREYEVKFLDSLDVNKVRPLGGGDQKHWAGAPTPNGDRQKPDHHAVSGRLNAAYRLGMAFASMSDDAESQREKLLGVVVPSIDKKTDTTSVEQYFYDCVAQAENDNERGIAALMMSGYYFGSLSTVLEYVDSETQLPDEKTLATGIKKMDNLKEYLNEALTAEPEVKTTMAIQRLEAAADSVKNTYFNCQSDYDENGPKYEKLIAVIKSVEDVVK